MNYRLFVILSLLVGLTLFFKTAIAAEETEMVTQPNLHEASNNNYPVESASSHPSSIEAKPAERSNFTLFLPLISRAPQVTFSGDWEKGITGPGNWRYKQTVADDRLIRVTSPVRQGKYAVRVEVRPGDDPINSSGERAEVLYMTDADNNKMVENESSGTQFYAFSVRLDPNWQSPASGPSGGWGMIFQLHGPDNLQSSPAFSIQARDRFLVTLHSGDLDSSTQSLKWKTYSLSNGSLNQGHWVDFVVEITFAKNFTGSVVVWRRDEGQTDFTKVLSALKVPTLQYKSSLGGVGDHYWKHGLYRSEQTTITNILWLDGLTRANTFEDAIRSAFPR